MPDQPSRSVRQVQIADHIWEAFVLMSRDMGVDRDSLINQALFSAARQNGYLVPTPVRGQESSPAPEGPRLSSPAVPRASENASMGGFTAPPPQRRTIPPMPAPAIEEPLPPPPPLAPPPMVPAPRAASIAPEPAPVSPAPAFFAPPASEAPPVSVDVPDVGEPAIEESGPEPSAPAGPVLIIYADGREVDRVLGPRFLIGRGKHCDLIINSGKVSREHAAIIREGEEFFMEDLGSSNGTWFDKKRITRRRIEDGDEYFVCSEKITCRLG